MSQLTAERLYALLPAFHRVRDAEQGEPLRTLLQVIETELERVESDIAGLYENWFIETCDEWVVPYIGDLLGVRPIRPIESAGVSTRAYVANTIAYRRRKGTAQVLEQLARDVTGWPAHVVESFKRLATTQHVNHVRVNPKATAGLRDAAAAEWAGGAFDPFSHTADMRSAARGGRHAIAHVAVYLWRLRSYPVGAADLGDEAADFVSARRHADGDWRVHPVGCDAPLFPQASAEEPPVLRVFARLAGSPTMLEVPRDAMFACRLPRPRPGEPLPALAMAVDPQRGRIRFADGLPVDAVWTQHCYGFSGDLGGGPYDRNAALRALGLALAGSAAAVGEPVFDAPDVWQAGVSHLLADDGQGRLFPSLRDAVAAWNALPAGRTGVIVIMDSVSEHDAPGAPALPLEIRIGERSRLLIVAGRWPRESQEGEGSAPGMGEADAGASLVRRAGTVDASGVRAHLIGDVRVQGTAPAGTSDGGACVINGLLLEGRLDVAAGNLGQLVLSHCSVVTGVEGVAAPSALVVQPGGNAQLALRIERSICPAVAVADPIRAVSVIDSLIGGQAMADAAPCLAASRTPTTLLRSTFFGPVDVQSLSASDCIFAAGVQAARRQTGCVRFSYVPAGSAVPRRYRCQPDLEIAARGAALRAEIRASLRPLFVSRVYGDPGFGQLETRCAVQLRTGAESGAEMGAFEFLHQPQREANLRGALDEYLRFGLEASLIFVT